MKALLLALFVIPCLAMAQQKQPVSGYGNIKFGSAPAQVKAAVLALGGSFTATASRKDTYFFTNVNFNRHPANTLLVKFYNNKFCQATLMFPAVTDDAFLQYYNGFISEMNTLYGEGSVHTDFEAPYKPGDGNELYALKNQKASYYATWQSKNTQGNSNTAILNVGTNLSISLSLMDGTLIKQRDDAEAKPASKKH